MKIDLKNFDYDLPRELIAQRPAEQRDLSRLMILYRESGRIEHSIFRQVTEFLRQGDVLVLNNTRVIPARLYGRKSTGGQVEALLLEPVNNGHELSASVWRSLMRPSGRIKVGQKIEFGSEIIATVKDRESGGEWILEFKTGKKALFLALNEIGFTPLPPYIKQEINRDSDTFHKTRYQTVYAEKPGAVAAPTAGLHFTEELLEKIRKKGIDTLFVTLHVSAGTFLPIRSEYLREHRLYPERFEIPEYVAKRINEARQKGGRIIAVGTTSTRVLEHCAESDGTLRPDTGKTELFITPGYRFKIVNALITNFHLPRSTLLMLVSAFAGRDKIMKAYMEAIKHRYRFYSYGDAMLII